MEETSVWDYKSRRIRGAQWANKSDSFLKLILYLNWTRTWLPYFPQDWRMNNKREICNHRTNSKWSYLVLKGTELLFRNNRPKLQVMRLKHVHRRDIWPLAVPRTKVFSLLPWNQMSRTLPEPEHWNPFRGKGFVVREDWCWSPLP